MLSPTSLVLFFPFPFLLLLPLSYLPFIFLCFLSHSISPLFPFSPLSIFFLLPLLFSFLLLSFLFPLNILLLSSPFFPSRLLSIHHLFIPSFLPPLPFCSPFISSLCPLPFFPNFSLPLLSLPLSFFPFYFPFSSLVFLFLSFLLISLFFFSFPFIFYLVLFCPLFPSLLLLFSSPLCSSPFSSPSLPSLGPSPLSPISFFFCSPFVFLSSYLFSSLVLIAPLFALPSSLPSLDHMPIPSLSFHIYYSVRFSFVIFFCFVLSSLSVLPFSFLSLSPSFSLPPLSLFISPRTPLLPALFCTLSFPLFCSLPSLPVFFFLTIFPTLYSSASLSHLSRFSHYFPLLCPPYPLFLLCPSLPISCLVHISFPHPPLHLISHPSSSVYISI